MKLKEEIPLDRKTLKQYLPLKKEQERLDRLIRINKVRKQQVDEILIAIEEFIQGIPDSTARQIFEMVFLEGKRQQEVADTLGYSRGRIPQIISKYLND